MLHRYWFEFDITLADLPPAGTLLGCGVTAESKEDAIGLMELVFRRGSLPGIKNCVDDVQLASLDQNHVTPNMGDPDKAGIWFPLGYE